MKGFKMNIQLFADEQTGDSVPVKYVGQEALEELVTKMKAYTDAKGIPTINQNDIRITDYDAGIYIWHPTSAGDQNFGHKIYYNGTAGTEYASISGAYLGDIILLISKSRTGVTANTWVWALLCADYDLVMGYTTANSGSYKSYVLTKFVQQQDVINNLTTSTFVQGQALHARQGKVLKDLIDDLTTTVNSKQDILTFDTTPTENSANPVTSGGLYTKFNLKADKTAAVGSFDLSIDNTTYVVTLQAKDVNGNNLGTAKTIDLPLESVVVSGSYDSTTKKVVLTLQNGSTIEFSVADLVNGLQAEITSANKLSADLVDDTNTTNKFVTSTEKTQINTNATNIARLQSSKQNVITSSAKLDADLVDDTNSTNKFVSSAEKNTWNAKQNALTFDNTPTSNSDNPVKSGGVYSALSGKQDMLTFDTTPTNGSTNPVTSDGVYDALVLKADKSGAVGSFVLSINSTTYVITLQAKDVNGNNLGTAQTIDLPLESVVVSGSYDSATQKVILTLKDGSTIDFSVADLISGLQTEITSTNKLSADLVDDTNNTHKFVTSAEKTSWNNKQNAITSNSKLNADLVDDTNTTNKFVTSSDISNWNSKQNALTFDNTPTNGSNNPVKSGGIYTALAGKQNTLVAGTNITIDPTTNTISATGGASISVDSALSTTSENPVQNKVITEAINTAQNTADGAVAKNTEQDTAIANAQSTAENALNVANGAVKTTDLLNKVYPVGAIYMSVNDTTPASFLGGTWEQLEDRFLLGCGNTYIPGLTGGEATHKLTVNEMPSHTHKIEGQKNDSTGYHHKGSQVGHAGITEGGNYWSKATTATGSGQAHNNMPPYLVVFMWKRTA